MRQLIHFTCVLVLACGLVGFTACGDKKADDKDGGKTAGSTKTGSNDNGTTHTSGDYGKPGFFTAVRDGRLWVFREGSEGLAEFKKHGEPGKNVTLVGEGPNGMTLKGDDMQALREYLAAE